MIKIFRGKIPDGGQERISLRTRQGKIGYRIVKFQLLGVDSNSSYENVTKIYNQEQSSVDSTIDFTDPTVLAAGIYQQNSVGQTYPLDSIIIFDNKIVNQDVYVTCKNAEGNEDINFYIELEVIPLTDMAAEYTTLKDLRTYTQMNPWR